ncbi:hypothetical protein BJ742DRAFT_777143 [Cladochytrium replicatum]|nr:hypothetical protein BJ742DRAFT_777143 [Cladochytrium replicatum]
MRFDPSQILDLSGKTAIVTGGNTGIGLETVKLLVSRNANVYLAARSQARAQAAIDAIRGDFPDAKLEFLELDLADLKQTSEAALRFIEKNGDLHILINNAGIFMTPFELTKDGIETQFAINHLGHFVFTTTLLDLIEQSAPSRIVNVTSSVHHLTPSGGILFDRLNDPDASTPLTRYGQSKLANILFTKSLAEKLAGKQVWVNSVHPGSVKTDVLRGPSQLLDRKNSWLSVLNAPLKALAGFLVWMLYMETGDGALTQVYAATSPEIEEKDYRGQYFVPFGKLAKPSRLSEDKELRDRLWELSEQLAREKLEGR